VSNSLFIGVVFIKEMFHKITFLTVAMFGCIAVGHAEINKSLDLATCQAARNQPVYPSFINIPEDIKLAVAAYKESWITLCDRKPNSSVHQVFSMAKSLEEKFEPVLSSIVKQIGGDWEKATTVHHYFQNIIPGFIPAFEGSIIEYEYFKLRFLDFKEVAKYGDEEDRYFFQLYVNLRGSGMLHPWYEMTWDYGGCLKFGEYNWIQTFQKLKLAKDIKDTQYSKVISELGASLSKTLEGLYFKLSNRKFHKICTCNNKDAVRSDLEKMVAYFSENQSNPTLLVTLRKTLNAIKSGEVPVKSQVAGHCSGG